MTAVADALLGTTLPLPTVRRGKVRDVYAVGAERLLIVATDRISAFDIVLNPGIPGKGIVLTQLTAWWLARIASDIRHHLISADASQIVTDVPVLADHESVIKGRAMLCWRTSPVPVECVMRGFLSGSAWKEYAESGTLAGEPLATGLAQSSALEPALFSPATKADTGHDQNIPVREVARTLGPAIAASLERLTRQIYERGRRVAAERGIIIADTKLEFGTLDGELVLIDEVLTPDSSRFWDARQYEPGTMPPSFDKQPVRDHLDALRRAGRWSGAEPAPELGPAVVSATRDRYLDVFRRITGSPLDPTLLT